jgi:membrane fusion protein, multidrug efflux system
VTLEPLRNLRERMHACRCKTCFRGVHLGLIHIDRVLVFEIELRCYIHSPIEGRAGARLVYVGNVVQAHSTSLLSIQRIDPIYASFTITERDLPQAQKGLANRTLTAAVRLPSDPEDTARGGRVEFLDNSVQSGSGTVTLRATLGNSDHHFWPGNL